MLLEPIGTLKVYVPDQTTGDIIGELNKRRATSRLKDGAGKVLSTEGTY